MSNLLQFGEVSEEVQKMITEDIARVQNMTLNNKKINQLLNHLLKDTESFRFKDTMLINFASEVILKQMPWSNKDQKDKISFCSYFHDILLPHDELALIDSEERLEATNFPDKLKLKVKTHANDVASLVTKFPNPPMGVEKILLHHHGSDNGQSLSGQYKSGYANLEKVFLVAREFSRHMIDSSANSTHGPNSDEVLNQLFGRFRPTYHKFIEPLTKVLSEAA